MIFLHLVLILRIGEFFVIRKNYQFWGCSYLKSVFIKYFIARLAICNIISLSMSIFID